MSSRVLIVFSLLLTCFSVYLYVNREKVPNNGLDIEKRIDYKASGIHSIQTNEDGQVDLSIQANELLHNLETDTLTLTKTRATQFVKAPKNQPNNDLRQKVIEFDAGTMVWKRPINQLELLDDIRIKRLTMHDYKNNQVANQELIKTPQASYDLKTHELLANDGIAYQHVQNYFTADGLSANLASGNYEFSKVKAQYAPEN